MGENQWIYEIKDLKLENEDLLVNETIFHNANGYIGVRSNFEEGYPKGFDTIRGSYINAFYDIAEMKQAEKLFGLPEEKQTMLNVADTQTIELFADGERFSMFEGTVKESSRYLDMKKGVTGRKVRWCSPGGKELELHVRRLTSFSVLPLLLVEYEVTPVNFDGEIRIVSVHNGNVMNYSNPNDPRVAGESFKHLLPRCAEEQDGVSYMISDTSKSGLTVCTAVSAELAGGRRISSETQDFKKTDTFTAAGTKGNTVRFIKYTVFTDSVRYPDCKAEAQRVMKEVLALPADQIKKKQEDFLEEFWKNAYLEIDGDYELNLAVLYNMYQLIQSVGKDAHSNIAAKGLSGEGYEGHYFWDTEMYMQPFFTLTSPKTARNLIAYRYTILDAARENAAILGHSKGALYPWRTIMGKECSGYFPAGTAQYHINGDIAYSVVAYYLATADKNMIEEMGAEILIETARLWLDVGNFTDGRFVINAVTGPDEYTCIINNNYYTNASAQYNLRWAVKFYRILEQEKKADSLRMKIGVTEEELELFMQAAEQMFLPYDEKTGINPQDDSFLTKPVWDIAGTPKDKFPLLLHYHPLHLYRYQVCKQADTVLSHFVFEDAQDTETIRRSFAYYEKVTTHDSSLSTCIFSIVASKLGLKEKAYEYFGDSAKLDLFNTHKNTKDGIHTANMGGNYMAIVYGFAGLRLKEDGLHFAPALPEQWKGYKFHIAYEDSGILVDISKNGADFTLLFGTHKTVYVYGRKLELHEKLHVDLAD